MDIKITHLHHPYFGQQARVVRVKGGTHLDLLIRFEDGHRRSIDAEWTDYREKVGVHRPTVTHLFGAERARKFAEIVDRLRRQDSQAGERVHDSVPRDYGSHTSAVGAMGLRGLVATPTVEGAVDTLHVGHAERLTLA
jgi:hypothetical protein